MAIGYGEEWELFQDKTYHNYWAVRPKRDTDFNSQRLFHFTKKEQAEEFFRLIKLSHHTLSKIK
jgi:hypothetical protein